MRHTEPTTFASSTPRRAAASLLVRIDPGRRETLQRQIYGDVQRSILDGTLAPATRLPSSRALADDLGV